MIKRIVAGLLLALCFQSANATFATFLAESTSEEATNQTSHDVTLPTGTSAGELVVCAMVFDVTTITAVTWPNEGTDWIQLMDQTGGGARVSVAYRVATGNETAIVVTSDGTEHSVHHCWLYSGFGTPTLTATNTGTANVNHDPPLHTPATGTQDYVWITAAGLDLGDGAAITFTTFPADSYANTGQESTDSTAGVRLGWARKEERDSSDDPSAFVSDTAEQSVQFTLSIPPVCTSTAVITDVDSDESLTATQANFTITGTGFCAAQQAGTVTLRQSGNSKTISGCSWSDTSLTLCDMSGVGMGVASGLLYGSMDIRVTNDSTSFDDQAITATVPSGTQTTTLAGGLNTLVFDEFGTPSRLFGDPLDLQSTSQVAINAIVGGETITINVDGTLDIQDGVTQFVWDFSRDGLYIGTTGTWNPRGIPPLPVSPSIPNLTFAKDVAITSFDLDDFFSVGESAFNARTLKQLTTATDSTANVNGTQVGVNVLAVSDASPLLDDVGGYLRCGVAGNSVRIKYVDPVNNNVGLWDSVGTCTNGHDVYVMTVSALSISGLTLNSGSGVFSGTPDAAVTEALAFWRVTAADGQSGDTP